MIADIDRLVGSYERGTLTRRQLLHGLAALAASATVEAQSPPAGLMKGRNLHHVNLQVSDVVRSEAFYRKLFGLAPSRRVQGPDNHGFDLPGGGIMILQRSNQPGRVDHFCLGVDDFDASRLRAALKSAGVDGVTGNAGDNLFVTDPDGFRVQVSSYDWPA